MAENPGYDWRLSRWVPPGRRQARGTAHPISQLSTFRNKATAGGLNLQYPPTPFTSVTGSLLCDRHVTAGS